MVQERVSDCGFRHRRVMGIEFSKKVALIERQQTVAGLGLTC